MTNQNNLLKNEKDLKKHKNINDYLKSKKLPLKYGKALLKLFEEQISEDVKKISVLQYKHMQVTDDWGDLGEQRVAISYCRHLLNISNETEVTQLDADHFNELFSRLVEPYENCTAEELRKLDEKIRCDLFYKEVDYSREKDINFLLEFLGSAKRMISGQLGKYRSIIYGEAGVQYLEGYRVTTFTARELERTPACVLSIAAVVGGKHIAMRTASCETIFANKWLGVFKMSEHELFFDLLNEYENVGLAFKLKAVLAYQARTSAALEKKKKLFIDEMQEGLIWHELGHGIVINNLLTVEDSAFGEALGVLGANVIAVMKEILADWAPRYHKIKGPLNHFCDIAAKDLAKAARLIYVYLSDNWFLGNQEDFFGNHTDIMTALILKHLKKDGAVNFAGLKKELRRQKNNLFEFVLKEYKRITKYLEQLIKKADFYYNDNVVKFAAVKKAYIEKVREIEKDHPENSLEFLVMFWAKIIEDLPRLNSDLFAEMESYLVKENEKFHKFILDDYFKSQTKTKNLRSFGMNRLKEQGFFYKDNKKMTVKITDLLQYFG